jgi:alpha-tubulin suppressor-like RCC1 family protein
LFLASGRAYGWGLNLKGQLGIGHRRHVIQTPTLIEDLLQVTQVACGDAHTAAITTTGKVYTFGSGEHGELGLGDLAKSSQDAPLLVKRLDADQIRAISVACGESNTGITTDKGDAYVWGKGAGKDGSDIGAPRRIDEFRNSHLFVGQLALGGNQIVALADLQLSKSLETLNSTGGDRVSHSPKPFNVTQLRILLESIPISLLPSIQERAHAQLAEGYLLLCSLFALLCHLTLFLL